MVQGIGFRVYWDLLGQISRGLLSTRLIFLGSLHPASALLTLELPRTRTISKLSLRLLELLAMLAACRCAPLQLRLQCN